MRIGWDSWRGSGGGQAVVARSMSTAAAAVMIGVLLAGCGSSGGDPAGPASQSGQGEQAGQGEQDASGGAGHHAGDPLYDTPAYHEITAAMAGDKAVECTATNGESTTVAYIDGPRMRLDVGEGPGAQHFLTDGKNTDFWQDGQEGGKVFIGEEAAQGVATMIEGLGVDFGKLRQQAGEQAAALGSGAHTECTDYTGDGSVFDPPADREFVSAQQLEEIAGGGAPAGGAPPAGGGD